MQTAVSRWGNSLGIRIPKEIALKMGISDGETIELTLENNHLIIQKAIRLDTLLAQITPENKHGEIDTGHSIGNEIW